MRENPFDELAIMIRENNGTDIGEAVKGGWLQRELGTMTEGLGLKLDRFKHIITDYMLSDHLTLAEPYMTKTEIDGAHSQPDAGYGGTHSHQVITPKQLLPLHPGDRVLVAPVNDGQDFVIVARVVPRG